MSDNIPPRLWRVETPDDKVELYGYWWEATDGEESLLVLGDADRGGFLVNERPAILDRVARLLNAEADVVAALEAALEMHDYAAGDTHDRIRALLAKLRG